MLIVDSHCHTGSNWEEPIETLLYQMNANGVSHIVLIQYEGYYDNSYLIDCSKRYGNRFKAVIMLNPADKSRTKTLERLHKEGASGFRVLIREEWDANDAVYEVAGKLGMVVSVMGNAEHFADAKFKKLLDRCPDTKFCLEHLCRAAKAGTDYAKPPHDGFKAALECAKWPNTTVKVPGLGEIIPRPRPFPAGDGCPWTNIPPLYEMAMEAFGVQRMMWGSNFPPCARLEGYRHALEWVRDYPAFQKGDDVEWIMGKSAAKFWGFPSQ